MVGSEESDAAASGWGKPRRLTFAQARQELLDESSRMTREERLMAMWTLNREMAAYRGIDLDQPEAYWSVQRIAARGR